MSESGLSAEEPPLSLDVEALDAASPVLGQEAKESPGAWASLVIWSDRLRLWTRALAGFFFAQGLVQGTGLLTGLLVVNLLPVDAFAVYAFASSILVTTTFFCDLGTSSAYLHFFHEHGALAGEFEPFDHAIRRLRRQLFVVAVPFGLAVFVVWGRRVGGEIPDLVLQAALIGSCAWLQTSAGLAILRLRLGDRFRESYRAEIAGALVRLAASGALLAFVRSTSTLALGASLAGAVAVSALARGSGTRSAVAREKLLGAQRRVLRYLLPTLPGAVYFAFQGQFVVWLAAAAGGTARLAEVGALGRLGLIVGVFSGLNSVLFLPKLATAHDEGTFRRRYLQALAFLSLLAGSLLATAAIAPGLFLALLGSSYDHLPGELLLVFATSGASLLGGFAVGVNNARSWTRWQVAATIAWIAFQLLLAFRLPLATLDGLLRFGLYSAIFTGGVQLLINGVGFTRPDKVRWS